VLSVIPCCCGAAGTPKTFTGCNGMVLPNYGIRIRTASGGTILETVTTDGSGVANITSTGTKWIESTDGRFSGLSVFIFSSTIALAGGVNTGPGNYICSGCCPIPFARTMTFTSSKFGTFTGDWSATTTTGFSAPVCSPCPTPVQIYPGIGGTSVSTCFGNVGIFSNSGATCPHDFTGNAGSCAIITYSTSVVFSCPPTRISIR
jgi:hypothetical protein